MQPMPRVQAPQGVHLHSLFAHCIAVHQAALALGVQASIDMTDFSMSVSDGRAVRRWSAKFMGQVDGRLVYTDQPGDTTFGFAGWTPYVQKRWPAATGKLAFKAFALRSGVPTPPATDDPARIGGPFLVKASSSSFGEGMRGPYLHHDAEDPHHQLGEGEFYENFIVGHIAKAWCWGAECVALELQLPTIVTGDDTSTLRELVLRLRLQFGSHDWASIANLAAYCGVASLDAVVPSGKQVIVEYRYGSRFASGDGRSVNRLGAAERSGIAQQFQLAARKLCQAIAAEDDPLRTLYTLDAIVDAEGTVLFLEMNCNPLVHPDAYTAMLASTCEPHTNSESPAGDLAQAATTRLHAPSAHAERGGFAEVADVAEALTPPSHSRP